MKKILVSIALFTFIVQGVMAQDYFFPTQKGAELTYKYYDGRGREMKGSGRGPKWTRFTVENVWPDGNGDMVINVRIEDDYLANLDLSKHETAYIDAMYYGDVKIEGDSVVFDNMHQLLLKAYGAIPAKDALTASVSIDIIAACTFPRKLSAGIKLPDRKVMTAVVTRYRSENLNSIIDQIRLQMGSNTPGSGKSEEEFLVEIKNCKVEALENVETPAGTFECYKIIYYLVEKRIDFSFETTSYYAEWISPRIGLVKRKRYSKRGKIEETMLIDNYKSNN